MIVALLNCTQTAILTVYENSSGFPNLYRYNSPRAGLAQLVEQRTCNAKVISSIPIPGTTRFKQKASVKSRGFLLDSISFVAGALISKQIYKFDCRVDLAFVLPPCRCSSRHHLYSEIHVNNLDNLRAVAIGSVFLHHLAHASHVALPFFDGPGGPMLGLHLFFLLSGYLITQSAERYSFKAFMIHRVARIFPAYLLVFIIFGFARHVYDLDTVMNYPLQFLFNVILMQQLYPESLLRFDVTHVSWSLTVEFLWYLAAPLTLLGIRRSPLAMVVGAIILSTTWVLLVQLGSLNMLYSTQIAGNEAYRFLFLNNGFLGYYCFFVMGGVIYTLREKVLALNNLKLIAIFTVFVSMYPTWYSLLFYPVFLTGVGIAALMIIALNSPVLENRFLKWIADISFSIYLIHFIMLDLIFNQWKLVGWPAILIATLTTLLLASLSYRWVEKPCMVWARRVTNPKIV